MRHALLLLSCLGLSACAGPRLASDCRENALCQARATEHAILAAAQGRAERRGDVLTLHPAHAAPLIFSDRRDGCETGPVDECVGYALMADAPVSHALVVEKFLYEGSNILLIDTGSGKQTALNGLPTFSPDGSEFLVAPFDDENDPGPDNLEIWQRQGDGAVQVWFHRFDHMEEEDPALPGAYMSRVLRWEPGRIVLDLSIEGPKAPHWTGTLTIVKDDWRLKAKSPKGLFANRK
jgi:hypothetical protein